jgi:predicted dehydrogenase
MKKSIWIVGPGYMGAEYYKILSTMSVDIAVIGRTPNKSWPIQVYSRGLAAFIDKEEAVPEYAIVCVDEENLFENVEILISHGVKNILVEKPAAINIEDIKKLRDSSKNTNLYIGYNRRFYQSTQRCKELINESKGPISVSFEFTEWVHTINFETYSKDELAHFFLCNSSHVADTVFYLLGSPKEMQCNTSGSELLDWHPSAAVFSGNGVTERSALFDYHANWLSSGRWGIEISIPGKRLILKPLEKLLVQEVGSLEQNEVTLDNIDTLYKPGLYKQVESFLGNQKDLCTIDEHYKNFKFYYKIANYGRKIS